MVTLNAAFRIVPEGSWRLDVNYRDNFPFNQGKNHFMENLFQDKGLLLVQISGEIVN
jgi:hypothetical protein